MNNIEQGRQALIDSPIGEVVSRNGEILHLKEMYEFVVTSDNPLASVLPVGASGVDILEDANTQDFIREITQQLFPDEVESGIYYEPYVALTILSQCMKPQGEQFNPNGVVSIAEFLDGLNAIKYGANASNSRRKTLDNISDETDYFNEGYQLCLRGLSSPFFNLYTRKELTEPITRVELAYITVVCTGFFSSLYNDVSSLGSSFNWQNPSEELSVYKDGFDYQVSKISVDAEHEVVSLNIQDYRSDRSMTEYKTDMLHGAAAIPLPMLMSMVELWKSGLYMYDNDRLDPLREVSRGEFCYFLAKLAQKDI